MPLAVGSNVITVTANDPFVEPSRLTQGTATTTISKPTNSYMISGTLTTATGTGISYDQSGVKVVLSRAGKTEEALPKGDGPLGSYAFACVAPGSYTLTPTTSAFSFVFAPGVRNVTVAGADVTNADFSTAAFSVSGISNQVLPVHNFTQTVTLSDGTGKRSVSADNLFPIHYSFIVPAGNYSLAA